MYFMSKPVADWNWDFFFENLKRELCMSYFWVFDAEILYALLSSG